MGDGQPVAAGAGRPVVEGQRSPSGILEAITTGFKRRVPGADSTEQGEVAGHGRDVVFDQDHFDNVISNSARSACAFGLDALPPVDAGR